MYFEIERILVHILTKLINNWLKLPISKALESISFYKKRMQSKVSERNFTGNTCWFQQKLTNIQIETKNQVSNTRFIPKWKISKQ